MSYHGVRSPTNGDAVSMQQTQQSIKTAHDWEAEKNLDKDFFDDGTITFFWYNWHTFI